MKTHNPYCKTIYNKVRRPNAPVSDWVAITAVFAMLIGYVFFFWIHPFVAVAFVAFVLVFALASERRRFHVALEGIKQISEATPRVIREIPRCARNEASIYEVTSSNAGRAGGADRSP